MKRRLVLILIMMSFFFNAHVFSQNNTTVDNFVKNLEVGTPVHYQGLTIIPIYSRGWNWSTSFTTLDEALSRGMLEISEVGNGTVPQVSISNRSGRYIYIMGGEIITGCRQDRIVGRDVLISPYRTHLMVPVYCVEQGRWQTQSNRFYSKSNLGAAKLRSYAQGNQRASQTRIWNEIANISKDLGVSSRTGNYQDIYDQTTVTERVKVYTSRFSGIPLMNRDTIGVLIGIGGRIISVDIFSNADIFKKMWPKILRSSAVSAMSCSPGNNLSQHDAVQFLRVLMESDFYHQSAVDAGSEVKAFDRNINASGLICSGSVIHLAAFPQESGDFRIYRPQREYRVPVMK